MSVLPEEDEDMKYILRCLFEPWTYSHPMNFYDKLDMDLNVQILMICAAVVAIYFSTKP